MGLAHFDNMESNKYIDDYRSFMLRESFAQNFKLVEYDAMKQQLEELLKSYSDVVIDFSVDIEKVLYISLGLKLKQEKRLKKLYNDFIELLNYNQYYIMSCIDENYIKVQISYNVFKNNKFVRIYLDKMYDFPEELKDTRYLYHVTPIKNYKNIRKRGLLPYSRSMVSDIPNKRVYLFKTQSDCFDFAHDKNRQFKDKINNFVLLRIDIRSTGGELIFYRDRKETQREVYYTLNHIPYWSICKVDEIVI